MTGLIVFVYCLFFAWNLIVLGTTAYVVFGLGYSGWWFVLAIICCSSPSDSIAKTTRGAP